MAGVLVDSDVFSYAFKGDTRAALYYPHIDGRRLHPSFATVAELYRWAVGKKWGRRRVSALEAAIARCVVIRYDSAQAWEWAKLMSIPGRPMMPGDAWVASAAVRHALPLVTHNLRHFEHIPGLTVISES